MPGSGVQKRQNARAIRAAKLRKDGLTTRQIAELIEVKPEAVKSIVTLGERLLSVGTKGDGNG